MSMSEKLFIKSIVHIIIVFLFCALCNSCNTSYSKNIIYGEISPEDYLTGKFDPSKHSAFKSVSEFQKPDDNRSFYLRREVKAALKKMLSDFSAEHPNIGIWIQSSTRSFYSQRKIWERKWERYSKEFKNPLRRAKEILKFSSMPGTSRHHWGTDFDINVLENSYYNSGNGKIIYKWLKKNAYKYNFCQPYTAGRNSGYHEERWHWSYLPIAKYFLKDWNKKFKKNNKALKQKCNFKGSKEAGHLAPIYVNSINRDCI